MACFLCAVLVVVVCDCVWLLMRLCVLLAVCCVMVAELRSVYCSVLCGVG